jgi:hypothetical protein
MGRVGLRGHCALIFAASTTHFHLGTWAVIIASRASMPEIATAIRKAGSRELPWTIAEATLAQLGNKPRLVVRVDFDDDSTAEPEWS